MRSLLLALLLIGCAGNKTPTGDAVLKQMRNLTQQQRDSFESPGDVTAIAPTPDSGGAISGDITCDRSTCLPR
jgi:hypothetical protein